MDSQRLEKIATADAHYGGTQSKSLKDRAVFQLSAALLATGMTISGDLKAEEAQVSAQVPSSTESFSAANPTGALLSQADMREILAFADQYKPDLDSSNAITGHVPKAPSLESSITSVDVGAEIDTYREGIESESNPKGPTQR